MAGANRRAPLPHRGDAATREGPAPRRGRGGSPPTPSGAGADALAELSLDLIGGSPAMREALAQIVEVAQAPDTTVLLQGESGTGKGLASRLIHSLSVRAEQPFVAIDCVALPGNLVESELFGHERGAFTGADRAKAGRLEMAGAGTVLLDEIGDMDLVTQGKLLRVLEEKTFERVGGLRPLSFSARVIAASHRDLRELVAAGRFRLDLYHRLSVVPIQLPPLRERADDIALLARHYTATFSGRLGKGLTLAPETLELLTTYEFPGNVRELRNLIERAVVLAPPERPMLTPELLPKHIRDSVPRPAPVAASLGASANRLALFFEPGLDTLETLELRLIRDALRLTGGKKADAARLLGLSRFAFARRLEKHGIEASH